MTTGEVQGPARRPRTSRGPRSDALRNRRKLLEAVSKILRTNPEALGMPTVAEAAGLSVATAYRYFTSLEELLTSYMRGVVVELRDYSHDCPEAGTALFEKVVVHWVGQLKVHGPAMIQLRSRIGFLRRLSENDDLLLGVRDAWERPIRGVMRQLGIPDEHFNQALFLHNVLFDPRDVLDLLDTGMAEDEAIDRLVGAFYGALQGWTEPKTGQARGRAARGNSSGRRSGTTAS
ncbi:TetR/AcrR family transcriptional regulator [Terrabacter sp. MAHUQ-38]|nr:TetR/AcrR family transcriptional regulator [Terrabacter sp. MAHUQ-38]MBC9823938.1 TetR/AcrR family transcriptional regulator [Terrabacter sp. MAHUQ-38]